MMTDPVQLTQPERNFISDSLSLLFDRCQTLAERVAHGKLSLLEAVDMAYSAADWAGLVERYGDDQIQMVLVRAFMGRRP